MTQQNRKECYYLFHLSCQELLRLFKVQKNTFEISIMSRLDYISNLSRYMYTCQLCVINRLTVIIQFISLT